MVTLGKEVICGDFCNEPSEKKRKMKRDVNKSAFTKYLESSELYTQRVGGVLAPWRGQKEYVP
jgi:hypothetical protein